MTNFLLNVKTKIEIKITITFVTDPLAFSGDSFHSNLKSLPIVTHHYIALSHLKSNYPLAFTISLQRFRHIKLIK